MSVHIKKNHVPLYNIKGSGYGGQQKYKSASGDEVQKEDHEMLMKQILAQGDFKGASHILSDNQNAIDRATNIDNWSIAFSGIQHRSVKFGLEHKKGMIPENKEIYKDMFTK